MAFEALLVTDGSECSFLLPAATGFHIAGLRQGYGASMKGHIALLLLSYGRQRASVKRRGYAELFVLRHFHEKRRGVLRVRLRASLLLFVRL